MSKVYMLCNNKVIALEAPETSDKKPRLSFIGTPCTMAAVRSYSDESVGKAWNTMMMYDPETYNICLVLIECAGEVASQVPYFDYSFNDVLTMCSECSRETFLAYQSFDDELQIALAVICRDVFQKSWCSIHGVSLQH